MNGYYKKVHPFIGNQHLDLHHGLKFHQQDHIAGEFQFAIHEQRLSGGLFFLHGDPLLDLVVGVII